MFLKRGWTENRRAFCLYVLLICLVYSPVVFAGKSLIPTLYSPHGVLADVRAGGRSPVNSFNADTATPAYYEFPINRLAGDIIKSGEVPLWNPYQGGGVPLAAQYSTRVFFPYQVLEDISPVWTWDFFLLGRLLFAAFFTFLFLKALGMGFLSSLGGGVFYMLSGTFSWFISLEQFTNVAMMAPLVMYAAERLAIGGRMRDASLLALSFALLIVAGQPEAALYVMALASSYFFFRVMAKRKEVLRSSLKFLSSVVMGLGLSSPLIFIFLELTSRSFHIHPPGGPMGMQSLLDWKALFAVLTPTATEFPAHPEMVRGTSFLTPVGDSFFRFYPVNGVWDTLGGYTGVVPVFLMAVIFLAALSRKGPLRGIVFFFTASSAVIILKNAGVPPFIWIGKLPLFDMVWSMRWAGPVWVFSAAVAASTGLHAIEVTRVTEGGRGPMLKLNSAETRGPLLLLAFLLVLGVYVLKSFIPSVGLTINSDALFPPPMEPYVVPSVLYGSLVTVTVLAAAFLMLFSGKDATSGLIALGVAELWWAVPRGYDSSWLPYKWAPLLAALYLAFSLYRGKKGGVYAGAVLFFALSFALDLLSPHGYPERRDPFEGGPYVEFLRERGGGDFRAAGAYGALFPNFAGPLKVMDIRYVNSLTPLEYHDWRKNHLHAVSLEESTETVLWFTGRPERSSLDGGRISLYSRPVEEDMERRLNGYSRSSVRYFVFPVERQASFSRAFPLVYDDNGVKVYENPYALERAYVAYDFGYAGTHREAQALAASSPLSRVFLEETTGIEPAAPGRYSTRLRDCGAGCVDIHVFTDRDGVLVLNDTYYPGWKATVNGKEEKVLRVNGLVRGVPVRKGESTVIFTYSPRTFKAGLYTALLTAVVMASLCLRERKLESLKEEKSKKGEP